jgi:hypothetical protein
VLTRAVESLKAQAAAPGVSASFPPADLICPAPKPVGGILTIDGVPAIVVEQRSGSQDLAVSMTSTDGVWLDQTKAEAALKKIVEWATQN